MANTDAVKAVDDTTHLKGALLSVESKFLADLKHQEVISTHNGTQGDATEDVWIGLLKEYLPARYKVAKAFAMDHKGNVTKQLDCLIYDAHFTPKLFGANNNLYVPAEAVYATFEIKPTVDATYLRAAAEKVESLRKLTRTSVALMGPEGKLNAPKQTLPIIGGLLAMNASWVDGLGSASLPENLALYKNNQQLDLVLTAEAGFCDALTDVTNPEIVTGDGALMRGLFRLIKALRDKNTVPAVDWDKYEEVLK